MSEKSPMQITPFVSTTGETRNPIYEGQFDGETLEQAEARRHWAKVAMEMARNAALSAPSHGEQVRLSEPDFYWVEADEGSWNSPEEWAQDYYDYNGEKPESVSFSCAVELPKREYDSFEFDGNGNCISCRLVAAAPSAGSQQGGE